jgi:hypothetical protein
MTFWDGTQWVPEDQPPPRRRFRLAGRLGGAAVEGGLITLLIFGLIAGSAFAAKGGNGSHHGGGAGTAAGSCSVAPDPVAVGSTYTVNGTNLGADVVVIIMVSDRVGTSVYSATTDTAGSVSVSGQAAWTGTSTVTIDTKVRHKTKQLATCSFDVT